MLTDKRLRKQEALIQIGLTLFTTRAYDEISIDEIAAAAGISKGLLYYYYPTKRDFYVAVLQHIADDLIKVTESDPTLDPLQRLYWGVDEYLKYVERHAPTYIALLRGSMGADPQIAEISNGVRRTNARRTLESFSESDRSSPVLRLAVIGWLGTVEMMSLMWLQEHIGTRATVCELSVKAFLSALRDAKAIDPTLVMEGYSARL